MNSKDNFIFVISDKAYIYSLWGGRFKVYEGKILRRCSDPYGYKDKKAPLGIFSSDTKWMDCSPVPEKIYNGMVWLPKRNDILAKKILIEYHEDSIRKLEEKIQNHWNVINYLKEE